MEFKYAWGQRLQMNNMLDKLSNWPKGLEGTAQVVYQEQYMWQIFYLHLIIWLVPYLYLVKNTGYKFRCKRGYWLRNYFE